MSQSPDIKKLLSTCIETFKKNSDRDQFLTDAHEIIEQNQFHNEKNIKQIKKIQNIVSYMKNADNTELDDEFISDLQNLITNIKFVDEDSQDQQEEQSKPQIIEIDLESPLEENVPDTIFEPEPEPELSEKQQPDSKPRTKEEEEEIREFIESFVGEGTDIVESVQTNLETLEHSSDYEVINQIFRGFHSLKGLAGFLDFFTLQEVTHKAETLLDIFRKDASKKQEQDIDLLYQTIDIIEEMIQSINQNSHDKGFENEADIFIQKLNNRIQELTLEHLPKTKKLRINFKNITRNEFNQILNQSKQDIHKIKEQIAHLGQIHQTEYIHEIIDTLTPLTPNLKKIGLNSINEIINSIETFLFHTYSFKLLIPEDFFKTALDIIAKIEENLKEIKVETEYALIDAIENSQVIIKNLDLIYEQNYGFKPVGELLINMGLISCDQLEKALSSQEKQKERTTDKTFKEEKRKDIRVDTGKLDSMFNLVGELITIDSMLANDPLFKKEENINSMKSVELLNKVVRDLQEISSAIRMIPLESTFHKMKRLVRDLSKKINKKIEFTILGEQTEVDKNIVQQLSDPLVHIIRNAIDHGIETPETRKEKGKNIVGNVQLKAAYDGNDILITIQDDGAGLSRDKILQKAMEKGIIKGDPEQLSDEEVFQYIFAPGFSTAQKVSNISGRGVGMDVVKKNIEKLRGTIQIKSKMNQGSQFILRIPLTLAVMDVMMLRVGESIYALPIETINAIIHPSGEILSKTMDGQEFINYRDEIITIIRLHEEYNKKSDYTDLTDGVLIIIEDKNRKVALFIDEPIGQRQTVVKGLSEYIGDVQGIIGSMILSSGSIGLILDVKYFVYKDR